MAAAKPPPARRHDDEAYDGPERRRTTYLTEEQIEKIAEKAAGIAVQRIMDEGFKAVGKNVVEKTFWIIGVCAFGLFILAVKRGWITL